MQKIVLVLTICLGILSCGKQSKEANKETNSVVDQSKFGRSNYAVIWNTPNAELVGKYAEDIIGEFNKLWEGDIIENAYFDSESTENETGFFPNIAFFLKAHSKEEAHSILNDLTLVTRGIGTYKIHPVGMQWLQRKTEIIQEKGMTKSFVTVWTNSDTKPEDKVLKAQSDKILELWNAGTVENVYLDIEGMQKENDKTDFVLFVNSDSQSDAEDICNSLPFYKEKLASYKIIPVGVFWYGKYENKLP